MKSKLYEISQENFETILKYYYSTNKKIKKYYNNIIMYKKYTNEYCNKIKKLFNEEGEKNSINNTLDEYEIIEINYGLNMKEMKNKVLYSEETFRKKINLSPIMKYIEKINKFFNDYILYFQLFIEGLEVQIINLKEFIEDINNEVNSIKESHITQQKNYIIKYNDFLTLNDNLKKIYFSGEDSLVKYYRDKKELKNKNQDLEKIENALNISIQDKIQKQNDILEKYKKLGDFSSFFNDSTNQKINAIKDLSSALFQNFVIFLNYFFSFFIKSFIKPMEELLSGKSEENKDSEIILKKEYDEILESYVKKIDQKDVQSKLDNYKIQAIEKNEHKNNALLNEEEIFHIVENMYNIFELIDKDNFDLIIEGKKLELKKIIDKLITFDPQRRGSLKISNKFIIDCLNDENNKNDDGENNENLEKNKENKIIINKIEKEKKNTKITKEEVDYLCKYMNEKIYQKYFLMKINKFRTLGIFHIPKEIFDYCVQIFSEISKHLVTKENDKIIINDDIAKLIIILSQTFYYTKDGEKNYIQKEISNKEVFHLIELWNKLLKNSIEKEINIVSKNYIKLGNIDNEKIIKERRNTVAFAQILPNLEAMKGFGLNKEEIKKIVFPFFDEYTVSDKNKQIIVETIESDGT